MRVQQLGMAMGLVVGALVPASARSAPPEPPKNVDVAPSNPRSRALTNRAANAEISGDPQAALALAREAKAAYPRDPWARYDEAMALSRLGQVDAAITGFLDAEGRFAASDVWGRSIAIYGGAHALAEAGRCEEAAREYKRYAAFVRERDPGSADLATTYAGECKGPVASTSPSDAPMPPSPSTMPSAPTPPATKTTVPADAPPALAAPVPVPTKPPAAPSTPPPALTAPLPEPVVPPGSPTTPPPVAPPPLPGLTPEPGGK
jgi:hypothetical protein